MFLIINLNYFTLLAVEMNANAQTETIIIIISRLEGDTRLLCVCVCVWMCMRARAYELRGIYFYTQSALLSARLLLFLYSAMHKSHQRD